MLLAGLQILLSGASLALPSSSHVAAMLSAAGLTAYYLGTLGALRRGHLSVFYPIIRSSPLAIIALNWAIFDRIYPASAFLGVFLILVAGFFLQRSSSRQIDDRMALLLAISAMFGSAIYSLADAHAMKEANPATFLFWVYVVVSSTMALACLFVRESRQDLTACLFGAWSAAPARILFASVSSYASYYLILKAFQYGADPAYVSAVRQASIPVSVVLAAVILREPSFLRRLAWSIVLALGIVVLFLA